MSNMVDTNMDTNIKKKGRPRKIPVENIENIDLKKKRGRKKKEKVEEEVKPRKRRGRKAAIKFFSSTIRKTIPISNFNNEQSILHLDIDDNIPDTNTQITYDVIKTEYTELAKIIHENTSQSVNNLLQDNDILLEYIEQNDIVDVEKLYEERLQSRIIQDNNLVNNLQTLHKDELLFDKLISSINIQLDKENQNEMQLKYEENMHEIENNKKKGFFQMFKSYITLDKWVDNIDNILCWWCCHTFDTIPIGLPTQYNKHTKKYIVKGVFCGFPCMIAFNKDQKKSCNLHTSQLIYSLYNMLTGGVILSSKEEYIKSLRSNSYINNMFGSNREDLKNEYIGSIVSMIDTPLEPAPNKYSLKIFGGELDITEFRNAIKQRKVYKMIDYPMSISTDYIEEVDIEILKNINTNVFNKSQSSNGNSSNNTVQKIKDARERTNNIVTKSNSITQFIKF